MSRMSRSSYGLALDRDDDWRPHGLCRDNPDMWCSQDRSTIAMAQHICFTHCPVRRQCAAYGEATPRHQRRGMVYGGVRYLDKNGGVDAEEYVLTRSCGWCRDGR